MKFAKYALAVAAVVNTVAAESEDDDDDWDPVVAAAGGACQDTTECADMEFCVFSFNEDTEAFDPSFCGAEEDCLAEEDESSGVKQFCIEFDEDSALRLWSAGAAAVAAVFMSM